MTARREVPRSRSPAFGLARALSKLGYCSRSEAWDVIKAGRVRVNGAIQRNPEKPIRLAQDRISVDDRLIGAQEKIYLMLNKPAGLVTTARDEKGRETVFQCLSGLNLSFVAPVGRLDRASEGLLLFTNDTTWAAGVTDPSTHLDKTYHVQVNGLVDEMFIDRMVSGVVTQGQHLAAKTAKVLRTGEKNSWLEIVLDEGRNRHIRRLMEALGLEVLRLVRVAVGPLPLGNLPKSKTRFLTPAEVASLGAKASSFDNRRPHCNLQRNPTS